jgi:hypothetical protein
MTHYAFAVQKLQDFSFKGSLRCRDALICGLGWSNMDILKEEINYNYVHPLNVIFDADDFTPQLSKMRHLIHMHFFSSEEIKTLWPKFSKQIDAISNFDPNSFGNFTPEFFNRRTALIPSSTSGSNNSSKLLVNEVFKKEKRKYYCGLDKNGYYFETFEDEPYFVMISFLNMALFSPMCLTAQISHLSLVFGYEELLMLFL